MDLKEHPYVKRLKGIALSSAPPKYVAFPGRVPDRYEHTLGVWELAKNLHRSFGKWKEAIEDAALLHDIGSPPFNHLSEDYMIHKMGVDHEEKSLRMALESEIGDYLKIKGTLEMVKEIMSREAPISDILYGKIDIDNVDNIYRFHTSALGLEPLFDRVELGRAFRWKNGRVVLEADPSGWMEARKRVYEFLGGDGHNIKVWAMLRRAHELCLDELDEHYFELTDEEALEFLRERVPRILKSLDEGRLYPERGRIILPNNPFNVVEIKERTNRLAERLGLDMDEVCVCFAEDKRVKGEEKWIVTLHTPERIKEGTDLLREVFTTNVKRIKFYENLVPLILSGKKTCTWRLYENKGIKEGDILEFVVTQTGKVFARARVTRVRETRLGDITEKDFEGHERYKTKEEMFKVFREYYGERATPDAPLKMIWFEVEKVY